MKQLWLLMLFSWTELYSYNTLPTLMQLRVLYRAKNRERKQGIKDSKRVSERFSIWLYQNNKEVSVCVLNKLSINKVCFSIFWARIVLISVLTEEVVMLLMLSWSWWQGISVLREGVYKHVHTIFHPESLSSLLLSSLETACILLFTEGSSAWIIWLCRYWSIKLRVWFLSRPCHQSQFARALAECNISLIRSTRKLRR